MYGGIVYRLSIEVDVGYVGGFDGVGVVVLLFREGDGEVLDAMGSSKIFEKFDEVSEMFDEAVIAFVGG